MSRTIHSSKINTSISYITKNFALNHVFLGSGALDIDFSSYYIRIIIKLENTL